MFLRKADSDAKQLFLSRKRSTNAKAHPNRYNINNGIMEQSIIFPENVIVIS